MDKHNKQALQVAKEIVVKFIEVGRVSPQNFGEIFAGIHKDVLDAIKQGESHVVTTKTAVSDAGASGEGSGKA